MSELSSFRMINWSFGTLVEQRKKVESCVQWAADDEKADEIEKNDDDGGDGWKFDLKRFDLFFLFLFCRSTSVAVTLWCLKAILFVFFIFRILLFPKGRETSKTSVGFEMTFVNLKIKFSSFFTEEKAWELSWRKSSLKFKTPCDFMKTYRENFLRQNFRIVGIANFFCWRRRRTERRKLYLHLRNVLCYVFLVCTISHYKELRMWRNFNNFLWSFSAHMKYWSRRFYQTFSRHSEESTKTKLKLNRFWNTKFVFSEHKKIRHGEMK